MDEKTIFISHDDIEIVNTEEYAADIGKYFTDIPDIEN